MITKYIKGNVQQNAPSIGNGVEYYGLKNDEKPTDAPNGAVFLEMDTKKVFVYDEDGTQWCEL